MNLLQGEKRAAFLAYYFKICVNTILYRNSKFKVKSYPPCVNLFQF